jgi:hypothetical protein
MYLFIDFMSQNDWVEGVLYINLMSLLVVTLKIVYYY